MRTVTFQSVLNGVAAKLGLDPSRDLNVPRSASLTEYINGRVAEGWKFEFFPEWTVVEQRYYRDPFALNEFITAGDQRFFIGSGLYYQALQGQADATEAPATFAAGTWTENSAWWAELASSYSATDWATGTVFAVGGKTRNPTDGLFYQCISAHTAGAAFDATQFGVLTAFDKYIAYEQNGRTPIDEVKGVSRRNPRVYPTNPGPIRFRPSDNGIQVDLHAPNVVFVEFRLRPPVFTTTRYSSTFAYDVGDKAYAAPNCYVSLIGNNQGNAPDGVSNWAVIPFPALLETFVKRAAFADALTDQKQQDRKTTELEEAYSHLQDAADYALAQQGQYDRAAVQTYGS